MKLVAPSSFPRTRRGHWLSSRRAAGEEAARHTINLCLTIGKAAEVMTDMPGPDGRPAFRLGPEIKIRMGQQLRVMYGDVMNQGVPDCCQGLLKELDALDQAAE